MVGWNGYLVRHAEGEQTDAERAPARAAGVDLLVDVLVDVLGGMRRFDVRRGRL
jgi:hypothetical protein